MTDEDVNLKRNSLRKDLQEVLAKHGIAEKFNSPDFAIADLLIQHIEAMYELQALIILGRKPIPLEIVEVPVLVEREEIFYQTWTGTRTDEPMPEYLKEHVVSTDSLEDFPQ